MVKISFIIFFLLAGLGGGYAQRLHVPDSILFSGVVVQADERKVLPNVTCRYGDGKATLSDGEGRFHLTTARGDTVLFTYVGLKPCRVVIPDTLFEPEYMVGVFLTPDTIQLSEAIILQRFGNSRRQLWINARNNMTGILRQAYTPVEEMNAEMNQRMMIEEYARGIEMKGHVDVRAGVGTQSLEAFRLLRLQKKLRDEKQWLNYNEVDLLKKLYYLEKKENKDN